MKTKLMKDGNISVSLEILMGHCNSDAQLKTFTVGATFGYREPELHFLVEAIVFLERSQVSTGIS